MPKNHRSSFIGFVVICALLAMSSPTRGQSDEAKPNRIRIEYGEARTDEQKAILALMKEHQALEKFQEIFSPFRLEID